MLDMLDPVDLSNIQDENARQLIDRLLNLIEAVSADLRNAQAEIQQLRDEINRLKGEQGKPNIKANKPKPHRKRSKKATIKIHREQKLEVDKASLPAGYPTTVSERQRGCAAEPAGRDPLAGHLSVRSRGRRHRPGPAGHRPVGGLVFGPGAGAVVGRCFHPDVSHHAARPGSLARRVVRRADRRPDLGSGQNGLYLVREPLCHLQNVIYGSVGAIIAFFLWSCLSAQIFLLGAEFTAEHSRWRRAGRPVETQPLHEWLADWSPVREIEEGT